MINKIKLQTGELLLEYKKEGRNAYYIFENNIILRGNQLYKLLILIQCQGLSHWENRPFRSSFIKKIYYSNKFHSSTNNPFKGRKHSKEFKNRMSEERKISYKGEGNPFYGKTHTPETRKILSEKCSNFGSKNGFYGKTHTNEVRKVISDFNKEYSNRPEIKERLRQQGLKSASNKKKTTPEFLFETELLRRGIEFHYNKILNEQYQYDFLIETNILVEVQGTYWHADPKKYLDTSKLNDRQHWKIERDIDKKIYAEENGYKIYYIWENEILKNDFNSLDTIIKIANIQTNKISTTYEFLDKELKTRIFRNRITNEIIGYVNYLKFYFDLYDKNMNRINKGTEFRSLYKIHQYFEELENVTEL